MEPIDAAKLLNEFQAQSRARMEATIKLAMTVSAAMLTLSVGAVLSGTPAKVPAYLLRPLTTGWVLLFTAIGVSLMLMTGMIISTQSWASAGGST